MVKPTLKALREKAGFATQRSLAEHLKTDAHKISQWELGKRAPDTFAIPDVARALGVTADELIEILKAHRRKA